MKRGPKMNVMHPVALAEVYESSSALSTNRTQAMERLTRNQCKVLSRASQIKAK